jgi:IS30 family transposase
MVAGVSIRAVARQLGRAASTISREVARIGGRECYRAGKADHRAWQQAKRPKTCILASNEALRDFVAEGLHHDWSPTQISGWLNDPAMQVSPETIYRSLFIQARGVLKKELISHLRSGRTMRRGKTASNKGRTQIVDAVSISERLPRWRIVRFPGTGRET